MAAAPTRFGLKQPERTIACQTNTQYIVHLSGYVWAAGIIPGLDQLLILDVAAGTGYGSDCLAGLAREVIGVDLAVNELGLCRRRYQRPNLHYVAMDGARLGLRSEVFDGIISQDTIEHITDDVGFLSGLYRTLKPGGWLVCFTPNARKPGEKPQNPFHVREYTAPDLQLLLRRCGFTEIRFYGRRPRPRLRQLETDLNAFRRWDIWGIRRWIPRQLRHRIGSWIAVWRGSPRLNQIDVGDVEYLPGVHPDTLIAVCRK